MTELSRENATVLKSSENDLALETYTVEKVAVIVPEAIGKLDIVWVPFDRPDEGRGVSIVLMLVNAPEEANDEIPLNVAVANKLCAEDKVVVVKLGPALSEVGIAPFVEVVIGGAAIDVGCCDERA